MVKNLRAILETWVPSLGWEATHSVFLPGEFHGLRSLVSYSPWDLIKESTEQLTHTHTGVCKHLRFPLSRQIINGLTCPAKELELPTPLFFSL